MVMTGPYTSGDKNIRLWDGADGVEIYIGKFDEELAMAGWLKPDRLAHRRIIPRCLIAGGEQNRASLTPPLGYPRQQVRNWTNF
jgi:hypothetical protein